MKTQTNTGFTLVEVLIVTAISVALAASIIIWQGDFSRNARLIDSVDTLLSDLNQERREVYAVVNRSTDNPGQSLSQVKYGYAVQFQQGEDEATVHTLVATTDVSAAGQADQEVQAINRDASLERQIDLKWGMMFEDGARDNAYVDTIAFVRDFDTEELRTYTLRETQMQSPSTLADLLEGSDAGASSSRQILRQPATFDFQTVEGDTATIEVNETENALSRSFD